MNNNNTFGNIIIVIILVLLVGFGVWYFTMRGAAPAVDSGTAGGIQIEVGGQGGEAPTGTPQ